MTSGHSNVLSRPIDAWLWELRSAPAAAPTVLMLPFAGGSATGLAALAGSVPDGVRVLAAQYPGRGPRTGEPPVDDITELVKPIQHSLEALQPWPLTVFGHSLGAMVGWHLATALTASGQRPQALVVSGCEPPHVPNPSAGRPAALSTVELTAYMRRLGGMPDEVLASDELMDLLLPTIRADLALTRTYPVDRAPLLDCPVLALGGDDDPVTPVDLLPLWSQTTTAGASHHVFGGGHFYYLDHLSRIGELITQHISR